MKSKIIKELYDVLKQAAGGRDPEPETKFHKHEEYLSFGIGASEYYAIEEWFKPIVLELDLKERLQLAEELCAENIGEMGHAGIFILSLNVDSLDPSIFPVFDRITENFHSWSHVDALSLYVLQPMLQSFEKEVLELLMTWSRSKVRWKRRTSMVVFTRKASKSGKYTDIVIEISRHLAFDKEDIVQKGVGWALKDNMRSAPDKIVPFVKDLRRRGAPSTVILYAIRNLKGKQREDIMAIKQRG